MRKVSEVLDFGFREGEKQMKDEVFCSILVSGKERKVRVFFSFLYFFIYYYCYCLSNVEVELEKGKGILGIK